MYRLSKQFSDQFNILYNQSIKDRVIDKNEFDE